jgi:hypothetical protein
MSTLYDITENMRALEDLIAESCDQETGELPANVNDIIEAWFKQTDGELSTKLEAIGRLVRNWESDAEQFGAEAKRLSAKKSATESRAKRTKEWTKFCLEAAGITKQAAGVFTFAIQKNGGKKPLAWVKDGVIVPELDPLELPSEYQKITVSADTEAIREVLENGVALEFACITEAGTHLRIR